MFTSDVNAAVAGLCDGGAQQVVINEAHSTMRNLLLEDLDERATMITGRHKNLTMVEGIDHPDTSAVVFLGYHAGAGADGVLAHTYLPNSITGVRVDGAPASEGRLNALVAAEYGVPVVLVTGDDLACADAAGYAPDARTVAVKDCVSRYAALCRPPAVTAAAIRSGAGAAMKLAGRREPANGGPFHVEVDVDAAQLALAAAIVPTVRQTGERTVAYQSATAREMIRCFKTVCTMISDAVESRYG
jgi:D-amino peptidase